MNGIALYLELRNERANATSQIIISPEMKHPGGDDVIGSRIIFRTVSAENPKKPWTQTRPDRLIKSMPTPEDYVTHVVRSVARVITPYLDADEWTLVGDKPLFIGISPDDAHCIAEDMTPEGLHRRIGRSRTEAGFPESMWK